MAAADHAASSAPQIDRPQNARRGILLMIAGLAMFSIGEGAVKYLTTQHEIIQIVWARYTFHAMLFLLIFSRIGIKRQIATNRPWLQLGRLILLLTATTFFFHRRPLFDVGRGDLDQFRLTASGDGLLHPAARRASRS